MSGVGEKTALAVLQGVGGIESIATNPDAIATLSFRGAKTFYNRFKEQEEVVRLSYLLATIKTDVELPVSLSELRRGDTEKESLLALFRRFEFKGLIEELEAQTGDSVEIEQAAAPSSVEYETILTEAQLDAWLEKLSVAPLFAFDTETDSLDYMQANIVGLSFAIEAGKAAYLPLGHDYVGVITSYSIHYTKLYECC